MLRGSFSTPVVTSMRVQAGSSPACLARTGRQPLCASGLEGAAWIFVYSHSVEHACAGGIKPCVSTFGADQFDEGDPRERREKASFFNWFYWSINIGALCARVF